MWQGDGEKRDETQCQRHKTADLRTSPLQSLGDVLFAVTNKSTNAPTMKASYSRRLASRIWAIWIQSSGLWAGHWAMCNDYRMCHTHANWYNLMRQQEALSRFKATAHRFPSTHHYNKHRRQPRLAYSHICKHADGHRATRLSDSPHTRAVLVVHDLQVHV